MAEKDLIIDDDSIQIIGNYFRTQGTALDDVVSKYLDYLTSARRSAIKSGSTAEALDDFIELAQEIKGEIASLSEIAGQYTVNFLKRIDEEDRFLY